MTEQVFSWNRYPRISHSRIWDIYDGRGEFPRLGAGELCIAHGNGRSYSDVCLNENGVLLRTRHLNRLIAFDRSTGRLACEPGTLLKDILELTVPQGWFLPVTPGTQFATVGGAVANDVHGKNHHIHGSFGHHVHRLELLRSNNERIVCGPDLQPQWFKATVGGLGLTGLITRVELNLTAVNNAFLLTQAWRFRNLDEFWSANEVVERNWPYSVAWIDCTSRQGKGLLFGGRHAPALPSPPPWQKQVRAFPINPPVSLINAITVRAFNFLYYNRPLQDAPVTSHYVPYFYPLDAVSNWNRIYGPSGFFQYQCVVPPHCAREAVAELISIIARSQNSSALAVLKTFGNHPPLGMLSFPRPGTTLAVDFTNRGRKTLALFSELDAVVKQAGGALYPAKDVRMSKEMFRTGFPDWDRFSSFIDPNFSSSFWRRVSEK